MGSIFFLSRYINELIECIILAYHKDGPKDFSTNQSPNAEGVSGDHGQSTGFNFGSPTNQGTDLSLSQSDHKSNLESTVSVNPVSSSKQDESIYQRPADWAKVIEAASQRRSEVLMPENLENMWTIGRNYKKKLQKTDIKKSGISVGTQDKTLMQLPPLPQQDTRATHLSVDKNSENHKEVFPKGRF